MTFKAIFIRPSNKTGSAYMTKWGFLPAPLGLLALAGEVLRIEGSEVKIIYMEGDSLTLEQAVEETVKFKPDLVGITLHATAAHNNAGYLAQEIKQRLEHTTLVAGGHHATFVPEEVLESGFDISVLGEGDQTIYDISMAIINNTDFKQINGIVYWKDGEIVRTKPRKLIEDLDTLPLPPLDLLDSSKYTFNVFGSRDRVMCVETSRGCPYACDFCSVTPTWGNRWRNKSNEKILREMKAAVEHGYDWIFFTDDIFIVEPNVKHREQLFHMIIDSGINMKWIVQMRADVTARHPELISLASKAGMSISFLGVESGSPEILKKMHKGEFTPQSVDAVKVLSSNDIVVLIGMMIGAPYETFRDAMATIKFSKQLGRAGADAVQFSIYTPLPGTRIFDDALNKDELFTTDWDRYDVLTPVMKTRVGPVLDQMLQFYASYSFFIYKFIWGKLKNIALQGRKKTLVDNGINFIMKMMPQYIREFMGFPKFLLNTYNMYWKAMKKGFVHASDNRRIAASSGKIIYDLEEKKNPYFMIKRER